MKKTFTILIATLAAIMMITLPGKVMGQEKGTSNYTITFKTASNDSPLAYSTTTNCSDIVSAGSDFLTGTLATATKVYGPGTGGLKLGASGDSGTIKMNLSTKGQGHVTSVVVNAKLYNSSKPASLKVNGSSVQSVSSSFSDLTFEFDGNTSFTYLELISSKYIWVKTITVNYTTYNVTYNANDANATGETTDENSPYKKGTSVTVLACGFSNAGKTFDGWYTNSLYSGTKYESGDTYTNSISADVTFYAKWTSSSPTLSVDPEEAETFTYSHGKGASASQAFEVTLANSSEDITVSVESDDDVFEISDDDKNFDVEDLTLSSDDIFTVRLKAGLDIGEYVGTVTISSTGADDVTVDLSGTVTGYTVTYKPGIGGSGEDFVDNNGDSGYEYESDVTVLDNGSGGGKPNFSKTGYSFSLWNTEEDGNGTDYDPDDVSGLSVIADIKANVTLHAQWTINSYDYKLTTTGETYHVSNVALKKLVNENWVALSVGDKINYNTPLKIFATPASGYVCSYSVTCGGSPVSIDANQEFTMPDGDITVTVNVVRVCNIVVNDDIDHGSVAVTGGITTAAPGTLINVTATPSTGYVLEEWNVYKTGESSTKVIVEGGSFTMPSYDVTVSASFTTPLTMTVDFESELSSYSNWEFENITISNSDITAHGGSYFGTNNGSYTATIKTKSKIAYPLSIVCYVSKRSTNTTSCTWDIQVSEDGTSWTSLGTQSASSMDKGSWVEFNKDLSTYTGVYVKIYYSNNNANRAIDDITLSYAPAPKYSMSVARTDNLTITATANATEVVEDSSLSVEQGATVTLGCTPDANYRLNAWRVYRTTNPETTVTVTDNSFTMPAYAVTITATATATRTLTYSVNGATSSEIYDKDSDVDLEDPDSGIPSGYEFVGWTANPANTTDGDLITSVTMDAAKTVYAVLKKANKITITDADFSGSYDKTEATATMQGMSWGRYYVCKATGIQFNKDNKGYFYNKTASPLTNLVSIEATLTTGSAIDFKVGTSEKPSSATAITTPTPVSNKYTYNVPSGNEYVFIQNNTGSNVKYSSIVFNMAGDETRYIRVFQDETLTEALTIAGPSIIPSGKTLNAGSYLTNTTAADLVIEDGGQLVTSNAVKATFKKNIDAGALNSNNNWYLISSPVGEVNTNAVTNLLGSGYHKYNLYLYDETTAKWKSDGSDAGNFTALNVGQGYLYRNNDGADLTYSGTIKTGDIEDISLTKTGSGTLAGFNLLGNPYAHNITSKFVTLSSGSISGCYTLKTDGTWLSGLTTEIKPGEGFFIQVGANATATIHETDQSSKYNNEYIQFMVKNSQYEDVTFALFDKGVGLNKLNHRNADVPMLYIPQNGEDYAIAMMEDDVEMFGLSFKAATTGKYTLSFDTKGEFSYLHVIDRFNNEDVDMLLDGEYSFIGSPQDSEARFIVKLGYKPNYSTEGNDNFAYQTGNEILVSGEGTLQVFDMMGRFVMSTEINGVKTINSNELSKGVYVLRIVGSEVKTQKIIIK